MSRLILILALMVAGFSLSPKPQPSEKIFIQIWIDKTEMNRLRKECKSNGQVVLDYPDGYYAILPCPMVNR